jgi:hypothetical protein
MIQKYGVYFTAVVLILTWPVHIGFASIVLCERVGDYFFPQQDHVLLWFPIAGVGGIILVVLAIGMIVRHQLALYASALVFFGGFLTLTVLSINSLGKDTWIERIVGLALALLFILCANYLWTIARNKKQVSNVTPLA